MRFQNWWRRVSCRRAATFRLSVAIRIDASVIPAKEFAKIQAMTGKAGAIY
jgi:hypothetical protein